VLRRRADERQLHNSIAVEFLRWPVIRLSHLRCDRQLDDLGTGNPAPMYDPTYRSGDNLYTNGAIS
jgi:hypothetical protein